MPTCFPGIDQIGHGKSPGKPALLMRYQDLIEDVLEFAVHLQALYAGLLARHRTQLQEVVATEEARLEHLHACRALAYTLLKGRGRGTVS